MKKIIRLTESDLIRLVKRVIKEDLGNYNPWDDIEKLNINAMKSSFIPYNERLPYIYNIIKPGYQKMREKLLSLKV